MSDDELYERAAKRADEKISFYRHVYAFIAGFVFFFGLNALFSWGNWWCQWIIAIMAFALIVDFVKTFVLNNQMGGNRDKMIEEEMKKMKK